MKGGPFCRELDPVAHSGSRIVDETSQEHGARVAPPISSNVRNELHVRIAYSHIHLYVHTVDASSRISTAIDYPEMNIVTRFGIADGHTAVRLRA